MPPKKKKQPKNSYYFFMKDLQERYEKEGRPIKGGMAKVAELAAPMWKELSVEEKAIYESMAKDHKMWDKGDLENKFTTTGVSFAQAQKEEKERIEGIKKMYTEIQNEVRHCYEAHNLLEHCFYFIHINCYCRTESGQYYACEIGLVEFTLENGIQRTYHNFIKIDQLPMGYTFEARKESEETHQIELPPLNRGERDLVKILRQVREFISGSTKGKKNKLPPLYTTKDNIEAVTNVITQFCDLANDDPEDYRIYALHRLLFELNHTAALANGDPRKGFPAESLAESELTSDVFLFTKGLSCSWHDDTEAFQYCSLSYVKRWCFAVADHCCQLFEINLVPGSHCPRLADTSRAEHRHAEEERKSRVSLSSIASSRNSERGGVAALTQSSVAGSDSDDDDDYVPLRRPKTKGYAHTAFLASKGPSLSENDFPSLGASSRTYGRGMVSTNVPESLVAVAGRGAGMGRGNAASQGSPSVGRGRGLAAQFTNMQL